MTFYLKTYKQFENMGLSTKNNAGCSNEYLLFIVSTMKANPNPNPNISQDSEYIKTYQFDKHLFNRLGLQCIITDENKKKKIKKHIPVVGTCLYLNLFKISCTESNQVEKKFNKHRKLTKNMLCMSAIKKIKTGFWNKLKHPNSVLNMFNVLGCLIVSTTAKPLFIGDAELKQAYLAQNNQILLCRENRVIIKKLTLVKTKAKKLLLLLTHFTKTAPLFSGAPA